MLNEFLDVFRLVRQIAGALTRSQRRRLVLACLAMVAGAALTNLPAVILGLLVNQVIERDKVTLAAALPYLGLVAGALLARQGLDVGRRYLTENIATSVERTLRHATLEHLTRLPLDYYNRRRTGEITTQVNRGVDGYIRLLKLGFLDFLPAVALAATGLALALTRNVVLGALMTIIAPVGFALVLLQMQKEKGIRLDIKRTKEHMDGTAHEVLGGIEAIRSSGAEAHAMAQMGQDLDRVRAVELRHHLRMALFDAAKYTNEGLGHIAVVAVAVILASRGAITPGDILTAALLFGSIVAPLRELHRILDEAHESTLHATDVFTLLDEPVDHGFTTPHLTSGTPGTGDTPLLNLKELAFCYEPGSPILHGIDLAIHNGETVGVVGANHCGKSTLLRLLAGLYRPTSGQLLLSGNPLEDFTREQVTGLVAYVPQTSWLFQGTITENIACGSTIDPNQITAAATLACIHDDIMELPGGYSTVLTERGANLSGGQRQRVALARALIRRPSLLLLDEATSGLDNETEHRVIQNLSEITGLTIVSVAHRTAALRLANRIVVMDAGSIIKETSFEGYTARQAGVAATSPPGHRCAANLLSETGPGR